MQLEEEARASLAEALYNSNVEKRLRTEHSLEGENLVLEPTDNLQRSCMESDK